MALIYCFKLVMLERYSQGKAIRWFFQKLKSTHSSILLQSLTILQTNLSTNRLNKKKLILLYLQQRRSKDLDHKSFWIQIQGSKMIESFQFKSSSSEHITQKRVVDTMAFQTGLTTFVCQISYSAQLMWSQKCPHISHWSTFVSLSVIGSSTSPDV